MSMSSSSTDLPGDWTVVPPVLEHEIRNERENNNGMTSEGHIDSDIKSEKKDVGSQVQDLIEEVESLNYNDSCSSSDIDIIDENLFDDIPGQTEPVICPPVSNMNSSSDIPNAAEPLGTTNNETNENETVNNRYANRLEVLDKVLNIVNHIIDWSGLFHERHTNRNVVLGFLFLILSVNTIKNTIPKQSKDDISSELHGLVKELQLENKNLKNQLMLEIQNEKLFSALEEQMKEVKFENIKLQDFILALQKESNVGNNEKLESQKFYKKEINQLKEQINILQFDNEELQKQLVRMRYGSYLSTNSDDDKDEEIEKKDEKLSNEVRQLRKDLESEIQKLKKLNELIEVLTKELQKSADNKESFDKQSSENMHKNKRSSEWTWKGVKQNIEDAVNNIQNINISELFSHYIKNKKVHLEDAFKNIGEYFKATEQKINSEKKNLKEWWDIDLKIALENLGEKWSKAKQEFFKKNTNENTDDGNNNKPEFPSSYSRQFHDTDKINLKKHGHPEKYRKFSNEEVNIYQDHLAPTGEENVETDLENESWMFERAAERAKLRESHEDMAINWYLKRVEDKYNNYNFHDESHLKNSNQKKEKYREF